MGWTFSYSCCGTREIMCYDNDQMTLINVAAIEMVEKLELPTTLRPQPYSFRLGHEELTVTHQTKVPFLLGKYFCEVLCHLIPIPIILGHLLLGKPWYEERDVAYDCQTHKYTVKNGKKCDLMPMVRSFLLLGGKNILRR